MSTTHIITQSPGQQSTHRTLSQKQLAANRDNAQKSTGPRSAEGKSRLYPRVFISGSEIALAHPALKTIAHRGFTATGVREQLAAMHDADVRVERVRGVVGVVPRGGSAHRDFGARAGFLR